MTYVINPSRFGGSSDPWLSPFALWNPAVTTSVWQDSSATTQAGVNDTVQRIDDLSGNGHHLIFASGKEATYKQEGTGEYYLDFDGSTSAGSVTLDLSGGGEVSIVCGVLFDVVATSVVYEFSPNFNATAGTFGFFANASTTTDSQAHNLDNTSGGYSGYTTATSSATPYVRSHVIDFYGTTRDTESIYIRSNGADGKDASSGAYADNDTNCANDTLYVGARNGGGLFVFNGRIYGLVIHNSALSLTDLQAIESKMSENVPSVSL